MDEAKVVECALYQVIAISQNGSSLVLLPKTKILPTVRISINIKNGGSFVSFSGDKALRSLARAILKTIPAPKKRKTSKHV